MTCIICLNIISLKHCTALKCADRLIHTHLLDLLDREMEFLSSINESDPSKKARLHQFFGEHIEFPTLMDTVKTLQCAEKVAREYRHGGEGRDNMARAGFDGTARHRRTNSTPAAVLQGGSQSLAIDDTVEDDDAYFGGWYSGGRRSPSPPPPMPLQSAGDSSPPQSHRRNMSTGGIGVPALPIMSNNPHSPSKHSRSNKYCPSKSSKDSSLFRLIVTLQLCLVRIEEANSVLCNGQARASVRCEGRSRSSSFLHTSSSGSSSDEIQMSTSDDSETFRTPDTIVPRNDQSWRRTQFLAVSGIAIGGVYFLTSRTRSRELEQAKVVKVAGKVAIGAATASFIRKRWRILTMNARLANSEAAVEDWIFHWVCLVNKNGADVDSGYRQLLAPRKVSASPKVGDLLANSIYAVHLLTSTSAVCILVFKWINKIPTDEKRDGFTVRFYWQGN